MKATDGEAWVTNMLKVLVLNNLPYLEENVTDKTFYVDDTTTFELPEVIDIEGDDVEVTIDAGDAD